MLSVAGQNKKRLAVVFAFTTAYMLAEVAGGLLTNSLALLADAAHMFTDVAALGLALLAIRFAERPATPEKTYGYYRAEILAALVNAVVLLCISFYILREAWERFRNPPEVLGGPMLVVAVFGLAVNLIGMRMLGGSSSESLNVRGAYLELLSDTLASVGVIIAAVVIWTTGWTPADPLISAGIGLFILPRTWTLLKQTVHVLMEGSPAHIDAATLEAAMKQVKDVKSVHDLHIWTITSGFDSLSAHVGVINPPESDRILADLQRLLKERFRIEHTTIQLEVVCCPEDKHGT